ncbi:MAG: HlyD family type I secretion periplasmic adaptor subunit [Pseudomonadota bacterium]
MNSEDNTRQDLDFPDGTHRLVKWGHKVFLYSTSIGIAVALLWSALTEIDVVTRGSGEVEPALTNQLVQHLEGGIVEEILVSEGQIVRAGDVLMRVKDLFSKAEFGKAQQDLVSRQVELIRLDAESRNLSKVEFPETLQASAPGIVQDEEILFKSKRESLDEQALILRDQYQRKNLEKREKESRLQNIRREFDLVAERVGNMEKLRKSRAISKNELLKTKSQLQQIQTRLTDLEHQIPQIEFELSELNRRQNDLYLSFRSNADAEKIATLREVEQLQESLSAMTDRKRRRDVRAPIDGKVHRLFQTTLGGVVRGGQNLAQLIPLDVPISITVQLSPKDRGKVWKDLPGIVKLTAYDYSVYGGLRATVTDISSDVFQDDGGDPYYKVKLEAETTDFGDDKPIVAGMSAEVDIITGRRTILDYLLTPVHLISEKALREG